jgi:hypothetical protein
VRLEAGLEVATHPAPKIVPTEVFRAGQTEQVPAFCKDGPEQRLQADGALQRLAVEDCSQFVRVGVVVAGCLAAVGEPVSDEGPALLVGDAGGGLVARVAWRVPLRSFSHAIIISHLKQKTN